MKSIFTGGSLRRNKQTKSNLRGVKGSAYRFRPRLESCEDRVVPATATLHLLDDGVAVSGTLFPNWGGNPNSIAFMGGSAHFSSFIVMGTSNSPGAPGGATLNLNPQSQVSITDSGVHTLRIELTSTDYSMPAGTPIVVSGSAGGEVGGVGGTVTATYQTYFDPANAAFGEPAGSATPVQTATTSGGTGPLNFSPATSGKFFVRPNPLFSMTSVAEFTVNGPSGGNVNMTTSSVAGVASIDIEKYVKGTEQGSNGGEGLTPGFWKTHSTYGPAGPEAWTPTGYGPDNSYNTIFNVSVPNNPTLYQALNTGGGGVNALLRHSTAALLNSARADIDYAYTTAQVIQMTHDAIVSGDLAVIENTKNLFAKENEKGATLGDPALFLTPTSGYGDDADSPPGPSFAIGSQVQFTYVVSNTSNLSISNVTVTDNRLGSPTPVLVAGILDPSQSFNTGDDNQNSLLDPGEVWIYTATEIATAGGHTNTGTVVGTPVLLGGSGEVVASGNAQDNTLVTDQDNANYNGGTGTTPVSKIDIEKYVKAPSAAESGGQGLTPGFWKQPQHFGSWAGYTQTDSYNTVFGVSDPDSPTLLGALQRGGGGYKALGRHAVAALLNAVSTSPDINYRYTTAEIISLVQNAFATGDYETAKNLLAAENEKGLSGGGGSAPVTTGFGVDADTPPGPLVLPGTVLTFTITVQNPGQTPLKNVAITDDHAVPAPVLDGSYNTGDDNQNGLLDPSELWLYGYTLTANTSGQNVNTATATGTPSDVNGVALGTPAVSDTDVANWNVNTPTTVQAGAVTASNKNVKVPLSNKGVAAVAITKLTLTWPSADGKLQKVSLGSKAIFTTVTSWSSGGLTTTTFTGSVTDRSIGAGKSKDLVFLFEKNVLSGPYTIGLTFSDGSTLTVTKAATMLAGGTAAWGDAVLGQVNSGAYLVSVDGPQGGTDPGMQARISAAIDGLNATLAAFGVSVSQVGAADARSANVHIYLAATSVLGGVEQGVLGVTESGGAITLITGWNWYLGADAAGVGAGQYDFQTVVTHELGHALGLGHSGDVNSVMFSFLATGQVHRSLTGADLVVLHEAANGSPEPLMAAGRTPVGSPTTDPAAVSVAPIVVDGTATVPAEPAPVVLVATTPLSIVPDWQAADGGNVKAAPATETGYRAVRAGDPFGLDGLSDELLGDPVMGVWLGQ